MSKLTVLKNINQILTLEGAYNKDGRNLKAEDASIIEKGAIVIENNKIIWAGELNNLPMNYMMAENLHDLKGYCIIPEIVDCHTHLVFAGNRSEEYIQKLNGVSYQDIAKDGGGILSTVEATNRAGFQNLYNNAKSKIEEMHSFGVGTIEIKSGYGLSFESEREMSLIIDKLKQEFLGKVNIINTFMAAHAVGPGFSTSKEYIKEIVIPLMKELKALQIIDMMDVFHEDGYFDTQDVETLFNTAKELNIPIQSHCDEFNNNNGAAISVKYNALNCSHLLHVSDNEIEQLKDSKTVATLLPGTALFLGKNQAPARKLLDAGVKVAIASDYNPGSCNFNNLLAIAQMTAPSLNMNIAEMYAAITLNSSHALALNSQGAIVKGLDAKFSFFKAESIAEITYSWGRNLRHQYSFI